MLDLRNAKEHFPTMPKRTKSRAELQAEVEDLQAENEELQETVDDLQGQLDNIADIVSPGDEDEDEDNAD
jgi:cell division protein FtsB